MKKSGIFNHPIPPAAISPRRSRERNLVELAVTACLFAARAASADQSASAADSGSSELAEVTVTAQRRTENLQDVPIAMQALTGETLQQLAVENFDDVIKYLPNVTIAGAGPGQSNIYMRGLSIGPGTIQGGGAVGDFPNVAVYLDDQSAQLPGRNLDVYAADLERIEVLEGPQGTLFGAGAEAGVLRYITNKPKIDVTEGAVNAGYATTGPRRSEQQCRCHHQHTVDCGHPGGARGHLQRQPWRIHQQCARHVHAAKHRWRHSLCELRQQPPRTADTGELGE